MVALAGLVPMGPVAAAVRAQEGRSGGGSPDRLDRRRQQSRWLHRGQAATAVRPLAWQGGPSWLGCWSAFTSQWWDQGKWEGRRGRLVAE